MGFDVRRAREKATGFTAILGDGVGPSTLCAILLFWLCIAVGGGGSRYGVQSLVLQFVALGLAVFFVAELVKGWRHLTASTKLLLALTVLLPLVQLLPLPPSIWQALPTGDLTTPSRALVGAEAEWFPLSVDRARTALAVAALIAPLVLILLLPRDVSIGPVAVRIVLLAALLNFLIGSLQVVSGQNWFLPYPILVEGRLYGLFANHNTSGLFFVVALCLLTALDVQGRSDALKSYAVAGLGLIFVLGVLLTQSRSSTFLLLVPLTFFAWRASRGALRKHGVRAWRYIGGGLAVAAVLAAIAFSSDRIGRVFARFEDLDDQRANIWSDTMVAIEAFFPFGSGMGTFDEVYQYFESLETIVAPYSRRAHNDYLEIGLEAGIFGYLLLAGWAIWALVNWWRAKDGPLSTYKTAAALGALVIAAQSVLDYPLRNQAFLCVAAILIAMLGAPLTNSRDRVIAEN